MPQLSLEKRQKTAFKSYSKILAWRHHATPSQALLPDSFDQNLLHCPVDYSDTTSQLNLYLNLIYNLSTI